MRVVVFAAALYLLAPGHPDVILAGVPLGQTGAVLLIALLVAWWWTRDAGVPVRPWVIRALGIAVAVKFALALVVPHSGWLANYYSADQRLRQSIDFHGLGNTRIDRQLSFVDTEFPVHFFNEHGFNYGLRREATEAFTAQWRGYVHAADRINLRYEARGEVQVSVDGAPVGASPFALEAGDHLVEVQYRKPKDLEGALHVQPLDAAGNPREWAIGEVTPAAVSAAQRSMARVLALAAWGMHALVALLVIGALGPACAATIAGLRRLGWIDIAHSLAAPVVVLGLTVQGLWKSRHMVGHVFTLTGGDDWLAFEMNARDIALNGLLALRGTVPGKGLAYFEYPAYGYFVAGVHWLTGESLAGVILANFVCLALATLLSYAIARRLTTGGAALLALVWLLVLEQLDFVRYYTVTLLSENLFFLMVTLTVYLLVRFVREGRWWLLAFGGVAGGLAAATRPTMLLFLPVALLVVTIARLRVDGVRRALLVPVVLIVCWFAAISPFTYRNYVMSGKATLITDGQARTFVDYNLPSDDPAVNEKYIYHFHDTNLSAVKILLWILWDHPKATIVNWGTKTLFGFGMVHWLGAANRPHPELILTSALYLASILFLKQARSTGAWLAHGFVFTHLATLLLTQPANYGYRMVLSMYLLMVIFAAALVVNTIAPWVERRAPAAAS
jgi:hypothetical protein